MRFEDLRWKIQSLEADVKQTNELLFSKKQELVKTTKRREEAEEVKVLLQHAAQVVQQNLQKRINTIVQMALDIVFDNPPKFEMLIAQRRGKTEVDILTNGLKPIDSDGGGVIDIITFALRSALWSIRPNRKTFILDEPFRNLSRNLLPRASEMVKTMSDKLGLQIIMVTHHTTDDDIADKIFVVEKNGKHSIIKEI